MKKTLFVVALVVTGLTLARSAHAWDETHHGHNARWRSSLRPWHGGYNSIQYNAPLALVVPPTAELHTEYSWGVPASRMLRIDHQFQRPWPNGYWSPQGFKPAAAWPSDTQQSGYYYIRGPW